MRLIDADELIYMTIGEDTDTPFKFVPTEFIENAEEVEAIPVEWLLNNIPIDSVMREYNKRLIEYLVIGWREENETAEGN